MEERTQYRLLPFQLELLKEEDQKLSEEWHSILSAKLNGEMETVETGENSHLPSGSIFKERANEIAVRRYQIQQIIGRTKLVRTYNESKIDLGTRFQLLFDGEDQEETFTMIESKVSTESLTKQNLVTVDSSLGRAVIGLTVGDEFEYIVKASASLRLQNNQPRILSGMITGITPKVEMQKLKRKERDQKRRAEKK